MACGGPVVDVPGGIPGFADEWLHARGAGEVYGEVRALRVPTITDIASARVPLRSSALTVCGAPPPATGPMSWAAAICIDLTYVMAARERQRDKQHGITTRRLSWPTAVLAGGVLLSLAANLAQAQPTAWGRIMAAVPPAAFLVAVSMIERRAGRSHRPASRQDGSGAEPGRPSPDQDEALLAFARRAAAEHQARYGQPVTRDALRARTCCASSAPAPAIPLVPAAQPDRQAAGRGR